MGTRESLNGRKNMARRKVKNGEKSPWGQCVFLPNQNAERRRPFGTGLIRHCPQGLSSSFFTFLRAIFFRPFRLSLAPTICPWVSEDADETKPLVKFVRGPVLALSEASLSCFRKRVGEWGENGERQRCLDSRIQIQFVYGIVGEF